MRVKKGCGRLLIKVFSLSILVTVIGNMDETREKLKDGGTSLKNYIERLKGIKENENVSKIIDGVSGLVNEIDSSYIKDETVIEERNADDIREDDGSNVNTVSEY